MDLGSFTREMKITKSLFMILLREKKGKEEGTNVKGYFEEQKIKRNDFFKGFVNISDQTISNNL